MEEKVQVSKEEYLFMKSIFAEKMQSLIDEDDFDQFAEKLIDINDKIQKVENKVKSERKGGVINK